MTKLFLRKLLAVACSAASLFIVPYAEGALVMPTLNEPLATATFSGTSGSSLTGSAWLGNAAQLADIYYATPLGTGYEGTGGVIGTASTDRRGAYSAPLGLSNDYSDADFLYLSGWFLRPGSSSSGGRVYMRDTATKALFGFGITDGASTAYNGANSNHGHFMMAGGEGVGPIYSEESAIINHWYEMRLIIELNHDDITLSLGYLYVRDATEGETEFRLLQDIAGVNLGFTAGSLAIDHWRIEALRNGGQMGSLAFGTAQAIPEPSTVALTLGVALFAGVRFLRRGRPGRH